MNLKTVLRPSTYSLAVLACSHEKVWLLFFPLTQNHCHERCNVQISSAGFRRHWVGGLKVGVAIVWAMKKRTLAILVTLNCILNWRIRETLQQYLYLFFPTSRTTELILLLQIWQKSWVFWQATAFQWVICILFQLVTQLKHDSIMSVLQPCWSDKIYMFFYKTLKEWHFNRSLAWCCWSQIKQFYI